MAKSKIASTSERTVRRCAIYTRKSTEEGLEQSFNSLDAQREACAAYIISQRHEGWTLVKQDYDDGGFSGGNMERPGLKRLLADVQSGAVDVIVVYKVDRLTRSLADFAKIVEILDARTASFVSVTQSFNTTTSMGRLTLNVLLSFAQFEREVTGERIRDKIAASKAKGMWMGGNPPLGYKVVERKLRVEEADAEIVRHIFVRYLALGTGQALIEELRTQGYRTKVREQRGRTIGGIPFARGMLFAMLANRAYLGETVHKGVAYPGEHDAVIERTLWDAVQARIAANRVEQTSRRSATHASLLTGVISDGEGRPMSPSHATKNGRRYRYYVTPASALTQDGPDRWRLPAHDIEEAVVTSIRKLLLDQRMIASLSDDAPAIANAIECARREAERLEEPHARRSLVGALVQRVRIQDDAISVEIDRAALCRRAGLPVGNDEPIILRAPAIKVRVGKATKLVLSDESGTATSADPALVALLADAHRARQAVFDSPMLSIKSIAAAQRQCRTRFARLVRLSWLAPEIVNAIADGRHPRSLTVKHLLALDLPAEWKQQRALLAIG